METDIHFIHQIGINSLVIESFRSFDPYKLGQMASSVSKREPIDSFIQSNVLPLLSTKSYPWFYNQTDDSSCQTERRSVEDVLPRSAIIAMTDYSTESNRGYYELVPPHIDVVHERRFHPKWNFNQTNEKNWNDFC
jgi:glycogen debranching enzyme